MSESKLIKLLDNYNQAIEAYADAIQAAKLLRKQAHEAITKLYNELPVVKGAVVYPENDKQGILLARDSHHTVVDGINALTSCVGIQRIAELAIQRDDEP